MKEAQVVDMEQMLELEEVRLVVLGVLFCPINY